MNIIDIYIIHTYVTKLKYISENFTYFSDPFDEHHYEGARDEDGEGDKYDGDSGEIRDGDVYDDDNADDDDDGNVEDGDDDDDDGGDDKKWVGGIPSPPPARPLCPLQLSCQISFH